MLDDSSAANACMSAIDLPAVPNIITLEDVERVRALRRRHDQELREYEEETRRRRKEANVSLRKAKRAAAERKASENQPEIAHDAPSGRAVLAQNNVVDNQDANRCAEEDLSKERATKVALEAEIAKAAEYEAERERAEKEQSLSELARLQEQLLKTREQRQRDERMMQEASANESACGGAAQSSAPVMSRNGSEDHISWSALPSAAPSVASSAAPSRSNSPTGSAAAGRCPTIPIAGVTVVVESSDAAPSAGKGGSAAPSATASPAATPRKGGKGKGKGSAPIPPPPTGSTPRRPNDKGSAKPSKFVNLHWKVTSKPSVVDQHALDNDPFLAKLRDPRLQEGASADVPVPKQGPEIFVPALPETVFSAGLEVPSMPEEMLEHYFKRAEAVVRLPQVDDSNQKDGKVGRTNHIGDHKRLNMIGVMLQKHRMKHKENSNREAIINIKRGVLQCDFSIVKLECLSVIRTVLRQHVQDGSPLTSFVQAHGEAAIWDLAYPEHHFLVYELSKVPQIDERVECMLFHLGFTENMVAYTHNLEALFKALQALTAKRDLIQRFFVTAHRLGQSLSQRHSRGFQLSTLEKLTQTKSTKMSHLSILHFVLALMSAEDAQELFTNDDIALLRSVQALGTAKVCDECRELAQGLYGVKQICESGEYTSSSTGQPVKIERRRKTLAPGMAKHSAASTDEPQEPAIDTDDCFHEVMRDFVHDHVDEADDIAVECHKVLLMYKELALFFDDLNSVYPPPKEPSDKKLDLVGVFYRFAKVVPQHRQEVEDEKLRQKVRDGGCC